MTISFTDLSLLWRVRWLIGVSGRSRFRVPPRRISRIWTERPVILEALNQVGGANVKTAVCNKVRSAAAKHTLTHVFGEADIDDNGSTEVHLHIHSCHGLTLRMETKSKAVHDVQIG
jgi:hypothetical protein